MLSEISLETEDLIQNQALVEQKMSESNMSLANARVIYGLKLFKAKCGLYLDDLNMIANKVKSEALLFEVKNSRDDVVKVCDIIQRR